MFEYLSGIVAVILFIWSAILLVSSWQLGRIARELHQERQALERWTRLRKISEEQRSKWQ